MPHKALKGATSTWNCTRNYTVNTQTYMYIYEHLKTFVSEWFTYRQHDNSAV